MSKTKTANRNAYETPKGRLVYADNDWILAERVAEEQSTASGIILARSETGQGEEALAVAVGPKCAGVLTVGDRFKFVGQGHAFQVDGATLYCFRADSVVCVTRGAVQ